MTKTSGGHRLTRQTLRGTWAPVLLPLTPDEAIDFGLLREELAVLTGAGLDGIYTNGTASEFHCLEEDEYDRITGRTKPAEVSGVQWAALRDALTGA